MDLYAVLVLLHVLVVMVAVGAVTVVDYLHLVGLRKKKFERQVKYVYPHLSVLINAALMLIILSGAVLVYLNPGVLQKPLFLTKLILVLVVVLNGFYLQRKVGPEVHLCITRGRNYCSSRVLYSSAICGALSLVTWWSIVVLAFTKTAGYSVLQFVVGYLVVFVLVALIALICERRARKWVL